MSAMPSENTEHKLCFEWRSDPSSKHTDTWSISASELSGVATSCSFGFMPGIKPGVIGLVLWNGQLVPVVDATPLLGSHYRERIQDTKEEERLIFIFFSAKKLGSTELEEAALALPVSVRSISSTAIESGNIKALHVDLSILINQGPEVKSEAA